MRNSRVFFLLLLLVAAAAIAWYFTSHRATAGTVSIYYTKDDGQSEIPWTISVRPQNGESNADRLQYLVLYAASQAVTGPPPNISAIRFPTGTHVLSAAVDGTTAIVDLSTEVNSQGGGVLNESGEFKSLVWTLTALPGIDRVDVRVAGKKVATLPGGSLELDAPLRRSDW